MRTAVIDIGTNTLLLLIVERDADGTLQPVVDLCRFGRLGQGLDRSGVISGEAIARCLDICRDYRAVMDEHGVARPNVTGTQALREAKNAAEFTGPAEQVLGAPIEIIEGAREAQLAAEAVQQAFPELAAARYLVVDVGGGSTEFIAVDSGAIVSAVSVPIGAVRLTERHLHGDPPTPEEVDALAADIDKQIAGLLLPAHVPIIATAGTATTMASLRLGLAKYDPNAVTGLRLSPSAIDRVLARLLVATVAERRAMVGMPPERADVIAAGVAIYARAAHRMDASVVITCDRGIRWGLAHERAPAAGA